MKLFKNAKKVGAAVATTLGSGAKSVAGVGNLLYQTHIFDSVPIVSSILAAAGALQALIENQAEAGEALKIVSDYCGLIAVTLLCLAEALEKEALENSSTFSSPTSPTSLKSPEATNNALPTALTTNLLTVEATISKISVAVNKYTAKSSASKLIPGDKETFKDLMEELKNNLAALHFAVTGKTFEAVIDVGNKVDERAAELAAKMDGVGNKVDGVDKKVDGVDKKVDGVDKKMDVVGTKVDGVGTKVDGVGNKVDGVHNKMDRILHLAGARDIQGERINTLEINETDVIWYEAHPFAIGTFGLIYRVKYERRRCAAKKIDLRNVQPSMLEKVKKEYFREVALMCELRSNNIVHILAAITRKTEVRGCRGRGGRRKEGEEDSVFFLLRQVVKNRSFGN